MTSASAASKINKYYLGLVLKDKIYKNDTKLAYRSLRQTRVE